MLDQNANTLRTNGNSLAHIPEDLARFVRRDTYSLLLKGPAGTGKTTLALTILKSLGTTNSFFYISTRISPKQLFQYYPWLSDFVEQFKSKSANVGPDQKVMPSFEDARLDEPESLFERITNQLMDIKSPIIIIDSWDPIASFMDREARLNNERVLQTWRERAGAKLIFISEHAADTMLDFLMDGIVELKQSYYDNVRLREICLLKLRGIRINRPSYIYTLESSIFHCFTPYRPIKFKAHKGIKADLFEITTGDHVRSGISNLDTALGSGLPRKGLVLLELDSQMSMTIPMVFLGRIVSIFLSTGNPVLLQPFDWIDLSTIIEFFESSLPAGKKGLFKVLLASNTNKVPENVIPLGKSRGSDPLIASVLKMKQKHPDKLLLNIMWTDVMQRVYGAERFRREVRNIVSNMRIATDLSIVVIRYSQDDILENLSEISDIRLRLVMLNDTLFLRSLVPSSPLYSLTFDDRLSIGLDPLV
ncbi:MAG: AAA family ATPase [Thermoproteota archaeon]|nr:AAA family ATPase [Thermoproteota archaeon]